MASKPPAAKPATPAPPQFSAAELQAIKRIAAAAEKTRDELQPGVHPVDVTLRIAGDLFVAIDTPTTSTSKPDLVDVLALTLAHVQSRTRQRVFDAVLKAWPGREKLKLPTEAQELARCLVGALTETSTKARRGNVTGNIAATRCAKLSAA